MKTSGINDILVSYNDKFVQKLMKKDSEKKRRLAGQKNIEKQAKEKLYNLLRLKPKDLKNISKKIKNK